MKPLRTAALAAREDARDNTSGQFGTQDHPEAGIVPASQVPDRVIGLLRFGGMGTVVDTFRGVKGDRFREELLTVELAVREVEMKDPTVRYPLYLDEITPNGYGEVQLGFWLGHTLVTRDSDCDLYDTDASGEALARDMVDWLRGERDGAVDDLTEVRLLDPALNRPRTCMRV